MGDSVQIVSIVVGISVLHIHCVLFQLHKQQRDTIHKAHNICAAAVKIAVDFQLFDSQKVVVVRILKVNDCCFFLLSSTIWTLDSDRNTVPDKGVFFLVDLNQGGGGKVTFHFLLSFVQLGRGEPRVQPLKGLPKIPGEQDFMITCPTKGAVLTQLFGIVSKSHLPAQLLFQ